MSFIHKIPARARPTYYWDVRSQILEGVFIGACFQMLNFVAVRTVGITALQLTIITMFLHIGPFVSLIVPQLFRIKRKMQFILWTSLPARVLFILLAAVSDPLWFCIVAGGGLFLLRMYVPMHAAVLKSNYPDSHRATIFGHVRTYSLALSVITTLLAGQLLELNGQYFRPLFIVAGACGIFGTLLFYQIRERVPPGITAGSIAPIGQLWRILREDKIYARYQSIFALAGSTNLAGLPLFILYVEGELNANYLQISLVAGVLSNIVSVLTFHWWSRTMNRYPNPMLIRAILSFLWAFHPLCHAWASDMKMVYLATALFGFLIAGGEMNWLLGPLYFCGKEDAPAYTLIHSANTGLRGMFAPFAGFMLYRLLGFETTFYILAALFLIASALMFNLYRETRDLPRFQPAIPVTLRT